MAGLLGGGDRVAALGLSTVVEHQHLVWLVVGMIVLARVRVKSSQDKTSFVSSFNPQKGAESGIKEWKQGA